MSQPVVVHVCREQATKQRPLGQIITAAPNDVDTPNLDRRDIRPELDPIRQYVPQLQ